MKVLDLRCAHGHAFEGWFGSEADFSSQLERGLVECPVCGDKAVSRLPSAPRLNLGGAAEPAAGASPVPAPPAQQVSLQRLWMEAVNHVMARTEDVGRRFPEEARRIHYGETEARDIRGSASADEVESLLEEGILVLPVPPAEEDLH